MAIDPFLLDKLICPWHDSPLAEDGSKLRCSAGHDFPIVDGIPVILREGPQTLWVAGASLQYAQRPDPADSYFLGTLGISDAERADLRQLVRQASNAVDPVASFMVAATNGIAYKHLIGNLREYPIPELRMPESDGQSLLDIGCNWGRWCIAAARLGYRPIGIDPSLGAVLAAKRAAAQLGVKANFVTGDARFLPFRTGSLDAVFSYSVLQHFSKEDAAAAVKQIGRTLVPAGRSLVQMPTTVGLRCLYHQLRRRFREPQGFDVRYWSIPALRNLFTAAVGPTDFSVDCYFGIGLQPSDMQFMTPSLRRVIRSSEFLRKLSAAFRPLTYLADSLYVGSRKK